MDYFKEFNSQKNKLDTLLSENYLIGKFNTNTYPMSLSISQDQSMDAQIALYENEDQGVSSKDAKIVLTFPIAEIGIRIYGRLIISDALMNKIKTHGKKLRDLYLQCEYAERMQNRESEEPSDLSQNCSADADIGDFDKFFDNESVESDLENDEYEFDED